MINFSDLIQVVKDIPTVEVVSRYGSGEIKNKYGKQVTFCPFHTEKMPSFTIYPNNFKCYGCGAAGDNIAFVRKVMGLRFRDAVFFIAREFGYHAGQGYEITTEKRKEIAARQRTREVAKDLEDWRKAAHRTLAEIRDEICANVFLIAALDRMDLIHALPYMEYWLGVLATGTNEEVKLLRDNERIRWWFAND